MEPYLASARQDPMTAVELRRIELPTSSMRTKIRRFRDLK